MLLRERAPAVISPTAGVSFCGPEACSAPRKSANPLKPAEPPACNRRHLHPFRGSTGRVAEVDRDSPRHIDAAAPTLSNVPTVYRAPNGDEFSARDFTSARLHFER